MVRDFTGLLNLLQQNPDATFESLAGQLELKPADQEAQVSEEFAEFTL